MDQQFSLFCLFKDEAPGSNRGEVAQVTICLSAEGNGTSENPSIEIQPRELFVEPQETCKYVKWVIQITNDFLNKNFPEEAETRDFRQVRISFEAGFKGGAYGESLGLAVALALIAQVRLRGVKGVAATGRLDLDGNWEKVGGLREKCQAVLDHNRYAEERGMPRICKLVVHNDNFCEAKQSVDGKIEVISITNWDYLRYRDNRIFEDTFGGYLNALRDFNETKALLANDINLYRKIVNQPDDEQLFPIPYDSDPKMIAQFFAKEYASRFPDKAEGIPVLLDVNDLEDTLVTSVQKSIQEIDRDVAEIDIRNALLRSNSLVLIFYAKRDTNTDKVFGSVGSDSPLRLYKDGLLFPPKVH